MRNPREHTQIPLQDHHPPKEKKKKRRFVSLPFLLLIQIIHNLARSLAIGLQTWRKEWRYRSTNQAKGMTVVSWVIFLWWLLNPRIVWLQIFEYRSTNLLSDFDSQFALPTSKHKPLCSTSGSVKPRFSATRNKSPHTFGPRYRGSMMTSAPG